MKKPTVSELQREVEVLKLTYLQLVDDHQTLAQHVRNLTEDEDTDECEECLEEEVYH